MKPRSREAGAEGRRSLRVFVASCRGLLILHLGSQRLSRARAVAFTVGGWGCADRFAEDRAEPYLAREARLLGDVRHVEVGLAQQPRGAVQVHAADLVEQAPPHHATEASLQIAPAHRDVL